jgi:hypothetical protein
LLAAVDTAWVVEAIHDEALCLWVADAAVRAKMRDHYIATIQQPKVWQKV